MPSSFEIHPIFLVTFVCLLCHSRRSHALGHYPALASALNAMHDTSLLLSLAGDLLCIYVDGDQMPSGCAANLCNSSLGHEHG